MSHVIGTSPTGAIGLVHLYGSPADRRGDELPVQERPGEQRMTAITTPNA